MRLKSLEMTGFKSFAERTFLQFNPGITAVVGPNGCGKSNIVDALRWVMGEQSARHLRGHLMEDVIFNGNESLPATGMAEVSLTFDNEDGRAPAQYASLSEIMVTRRLFRSGESEYYVNKAPCRLKDIIELLLGTGVGNKAYSIVEQGRVDELVNAKPEDRRSFIEEAAGTSKYKSRKLAAERKLERTHQNLLRVSDVVREIERQIRTMELQAKKAERYRGLREELKNKELLWADFQRQCFEVEISSLDIKFKAAENRLTHLLTTLHTQEAESENIRLALLEADKDISVLQEAVYQHRVRIQSEEQKIHFYKNDLHELDHGEKINQAELSEMRERLDFLSREIEGLKSAKENFAQMCLFEETSLQRREKDLEKAKLQMQLHQSQLEGEKGFLIELASQISQQRNDRLARERRCSEIRRELSKNEQESSDTTQSLDAWKEKERARKADLDHSRARSEEVERQIADAAAHLEAWRTLETQQEEKIGRLKEKLGESCSRFESLVALQKNYEGYQEGVRAIMLKRQKEAGFDGVLGLVAEVIEAPEQFEKALAAVLGDRLQYIIVRGHQEGLKAIEYLKQESSGRGTFIPRQLSRIKQRSLPLGEPEVVAPLLEAVSIKDGYGKIAEYLLGDVVVVPDLKAGLNLWSRNGFVNTLVTLEGEVIDPMGVVSGGNPESLEGNSLFHKRRMRELERVRAEVEIQLQGEEKELAGLRERMGGAEQARSLLEGESRRLEVERIRLEHELFQADREVKRLEETLLLLEQEQADMLTACNLIEESVEESERIIQGRLRERESREKSMADLQETLSQLSTNIQRIEEEVTESRIRAAALGERRENTQYNLQDRIKLQQELAELIQHREGSVAGTHLRKRQVEDAIRLAEVSLADEREKLEVMGRTLEGERDRYREISARLTDIEEAIRSLRSEVGEGQEEKNQIQLAVSEKKINLRHLLDTYREKYEVDLREFTPQDSGGEAVVEELPREIDELKERLERMGEVNLAAIGEFEELRNRHGFLNQQKEDLEKSMDNLRQTITKLNRICRVRFKESFEQINERFQEVFPRLFQGGKARLVLTDENDYLETGVDIVAQPPGKKLQSITLLSGGEKALTAVSLLFAIFLTKPSPFCFLDEVDAPLDDANIDRFNDILKGMSQSSQFILITHNKRTMQSADVLYGITMAEPGISKVVSVRMN